MPASSLTTMTPAPVPKDEMRPSNLPACVMMGTLASALEQRTMTQHSPHAYEQLLVGWIAGAFSTPVALRETTHVTESAPAIATITSNHRQGGPQAVRVCEK